MTAELDTFVHLLEGAPLERVLAWSRSHESAMDQAVQLCSDGLLQRSLLPRCIQVFGLTPTPSAAPWLGVVASPDSKFSRTIKIGAIASLGLIGDPSVAPILKDLISSWGARSAEIIDVILDSFATTRDDTGEVDLILQRFADSSQPELSHTAQLALRMRGRHR